MHRNPGNETIGSRCTGAEPSTVRLRSVVKMPSITRRSEPRHYMTPRSSSPAIRQAGVLRRARWSAELQGVGSFSPAESWQTTVNPSVDGDPTAPPRHPDEAVPPHQGREREGEELLGLWGGVNRQIHHIDAQQSKYNPKMHRPQGALRGERRDAMASGENSLLDLSYARPHIALLKAEEAAVAKATAELKAGTTGMRVDLAGMRFPEARFVGNPSPTPNEAGPRQSFIGERLRPDDMRRFSSISEGVFRARLASMSCREESGRAQRDMQLLLRLVLRNRQVLGTSRTVAQVM